MLTAIGLYGLALVSAGSLLVVEDPPAQADVIVILGGDGPPRAAQAAKLWHEGMAPLVLVTGYGDCDFIRDMLVRLGVDSAAVSTECLSLNTWENATFAQPILTGMGQKRHSGHELVSFTAGSKALPVCDASNPVDFPSCATNRVAVAACHQRRWGAGVQGIRQSAPLRPQKQFLAGFASSSGGARLMNTLLVFASSVVLSCSSVGE